MTYMAPFIPRLSDLTANLRELLRKDTDYDWNNSHQKSLQEIKDLICKEMLHYYDPSKKSVIQVDASSRGLGAALIQEGKPIAFGSKSLTKTEQRYPNIERELLAVVFDCERFRTYIYGCAFEVESDHKPLVRICLENLIAAPPRLQRMLLRLQEYDMVIKYRPGKEMLLADGLSRFPNKKKTKQNKEVIDLDVKVDFVQFSAEKLTQATNANPILCELRVRILQGWPESRRELHKDLHIEMSSLLRMAFCLKETGY